MKRPKIEDYIGRTEGYMQYILELEKYCNFLECNRDEKEDDKREQWCKLHTDTKGWKGFLDG